MTEHAVEKAIRWLPALFALLIVAPFTWWILDRVPVYKLGPGIVEPSAAKPGEEVTITWHAEFSGRECPGKSQREAISLVDHQLYLVEPRERRGEYHPSKEDPLKGSVTTPPFVIPYGMASGPAVYKVYNFFYCNWLQKVLNWPIVYESPTIPFTVLPDDKKN